MKNKEQKKILYIAGLGYSGSTILSILLGNHPSIIGMGEFYSSFKNKKINFEERVCSCGHNLNECNFWSKYRTIYRNYKKGKINYWDGYEKTIRQFYKENPNKILVDSSKSLDFLKDISNKLKSSYEINLKTLYLLRDVRGFSYSLRKRRIKRGKWGNVFLYQLGWWHKQKKFKKIFADSTISYLQLGYEEFVLQNRKSLKKICHFIDIDFSEKLLESPVKSSSHLLSGNPIRTNSKKNKIFYDYSWFKDFGINLSYASLPFVAKWNENNVYNNL